MLLNLFWSAAGCRPPIIERCLIRRSRVVRPFGTTPESFEAVASSCKPSPTTAAAAAHPAPLFLDIVRVPHIVARTGAVFRLWTTEGLMMLGPSWSYPCVPQVCVTIPVQKRTTTSKGMHNSAARISAGDVSKSC